MAAWQTPLQLNSDGHPMAPINLHATLVFLGEVAVERLELLKLAAEEVSSEQFHINFDKARYWGGSHVIYAAPNVVPVELIKLHALLEQRLRHHHFNFDSRTYKPHVTLLRNAHWTDEPLPDMPAVSWFVKEFALVSSVSSEAGMQYEILAKFSLKEN